MCTTLRSQGRAAEAVRQRRVHTYMLLRERRRLDFGDYPTPKGTPGVCRVPVSNPNDEISECHASEYTESKEIPVHMVIDETFLLKPLVPPKNDRAWISFEKRHQA